MFIAFRKNSLAKLLAMAIEMPTRLMTTGASSRLDPDPKFFPATITSPLRTPLGNSGRAASKTCFAISSGSRSVRYFPDIIWSVSTLSPNTQALPESLKLDQSTLVFFPLRPINRTSDRTTISPETRIASQDIPPKYVPGQLVTLGGGTQRVVSKLTKPSPKSSAIARRTPMEVFKNSVLHSIAIRDTV